MITRPRSHLLYITVVLCHPRSPVRSPEPLTSGPPTSQLGVVCKCRRVIYKEKKRRCSPCRWPESRIWTSLAVRVCSNYKPLEKGAHKCSELFPLPIRRPHSACNAKELRAQSSPRGRPLGEMFKDEQIRKTQANQTYPERHPSFPLRRHLLSFPYIIGAFSPGRPWLREPNNSLGGTLDMLLPLSKLAVGAGT